MDEIVENGENDPNMVDGMEDYVVEDKILTITKTKFITKSNSKS